MQIYLYLFISLEKNFIIKIMKSAIYFATCNNHYLLKINFM